jgi:hypothetical protein
VSTWRTHAEAVIKQALADAAEQGLDDAATVRLVDSRYPFGMREYHPYQMWLKVRRELVPVVREKAKAREAAKIAQAREKIRTAWIETTGQEELPL